MQSLSFDAHQLKTTSSRLLRVLVFFTGDNVQCTIAWPVQLAKAMKQCKIQNANSYTISRDYFLNHFTRYYSTSHWAAAYISYCSSHALASCGEAATASQDWVDAMQLCNSELVGSLVSTMLSSCDANYSALEERETWMRISLHSRNKEIGPWENWITDRETSHAGQPEKRIFSYTSAKSISP